MSQHIGDPRYEQLPVLQEAFAAKRGADAADKRIQLEQIAADAEAMRYLAEMECPNDLKDWGSGHGIPAFAEFTWQAGFAAGWRMACARSQAKDSGQLNSLTTGVPAIVKGRDR